MTNIYMDMEDYAKRLWDWTGLNGSFKRGIRVGDIDGFVEVGNRFLFIEGKPTDKPVSAGQLIAFTRLSLLPMVTFVILRGNPPVDVVGWDVIGSKTHDGDYPAFASFVNDWFIWAEENPYPYQEEKDKKDGSACARHEQIDNTKHDWIDPAFNQPNLFYPR